MQKKVGLTICLLKAYWYRWVYVQKKTSDGPFELYTDVESKITQYNRIKRFFKIGLLVETICFFIELQAAARNGSLDYWMITLFIGIIVLAFLRIVWKCKWKVDQLRFDSK
jgi:hypothetical protein